MLWASQRHILLLMRVSAACPLFRKISAHSKDVAEPPPDNPACLCGQKYQGGDPLAWAPCSECGVWQHLLCFAGFGDEEGKAVREDVDWEYLPAWRVCALCENRQCLDSPVEGQGTLVICPQSIKDGQWVDEIAKHTFPTIPYAVGVSFPWYSQ